MIGWRKVNSRHFAILVTALNTLRTLSISDVQTSSSSHKLSLSSHAFFIRCSVSTNLRSASTDFVSAVSILLPPAIVFLYLIMKAFVDIVELILLFRFLNFD